MTDEASPFPIAPLPKPTAYDIACDAQRAAEGLFARWLDDHPPPSFQKLAERHGGAGCIPPDILTKFDDAMMEWRRRYGTRPRYNGA
jgi:hypothetical protein